jgi:hypothetical protein
MSDMNGSPHRKGLARRELHTIKQRQQAARASGDYAVIGTTPQMAGELLAEACDLRWG